MGAFKYLTDKIKEASFSEFPFRHVHIDNFLAENHFRQIVAAPELAIPPVRSDAELFDALFTRGYKIIGFPGCITDQKAYLEWHVSKSKSTLVHTTLEGFGMTLRLMGDKRTPIVQDLTEFTGSSEFMGLLAEKFGLDYGITKSDTGLQKYLDGYEISPHPDIRRKALTYMLNINPHANSEKLNHHTHYLTFRAEYKYVQTFWDGNPNVDRCWVPWEWCQTEKQQPTNNSIVIFAPGNDTMHAVLANYDHLAGQRTQMYGNLWFPVDPTLQTGVDWELLVIGKPKAKAVAASVPLRSRVGAFLPAPIKRLLRRKPDNGSVVADRFQ